MSAKGRFETFPAAHWRERIEAKPGDPEYKLTISAPTNADVREIDATIVADRRRSGDLGEDIRVVNAIDRAGEVYQLPLAIGDHHLQLADRAERARLESDKISGLPPYPTG
jgi:hypothetical protein